MIESLWFQERHRGQKSHSHLVLPRTLPTTKPSPAGCPRILSHNKLLFYTTKTICRNRSRQIHMGKPRLLGPNSKSQPWWDSITQSLQPGHTHGLGGPSKHPSSATEPVHMMEMAHHTTLRHHKVTNSFKIKTDTHHD